MVRPTKIGSMWMSRTKTFIHGPRFHKPIGTIFMRGKPGWPRYKMMQINGGIPFIQSIMRPVYPEELKHINKLIEWTGEEYVFKFLIKPFIKIEGKNYAFYSFAFTKDRLNKLINHIKNNNYYRIKPLTYRGIKIYRIYKINKPR